MKINQRSHECVLGETKFHLHERWLKRPVTKGFTIILNSAKALFICGLHPRINPEFYPSMLATLFYWNLDFACWTQFRTDLWAQGMPLLTSQELSQTRLCSFPRQGLKGPSHFSRELQKVSRRLLGGILHPHFFFFLMKKYKGTRENTTLCWVHWTCYNNGS